MKTCPVCDTDYPDQHHTCPTDGAVLVQMSELAPDAIVRGKYRIVRLLGRGGFGVVYLAENLLLGGQVALKFLSDEVRRNSAFIKRFRNEARAAYRINHPHIIDVLDLDQAEDGCLFIAMEYADGPGLRKLIQEAPGGMPIARALELTRQIASGLAAAHARGTVHRDIKPENILTMKDTGAPKILDFGIATMLEGTVFASRSGGGMLTPDYAAPEQWRGMPGAQLDGRTDLYALGGVLFEMLTGRTPFHAHNYEGWMCQHLFETPQPPSSLRPELAATPGLDDLMLRLLARDREQRPASAADFVLEVSHLLESGYGMNEEPEVEQVVIAKYTPKLPPPVVSIPGGRTSMLDEPVKHPEVQPIAALQPEEIHLEEIFDEEVQPLESLDSKVSEPSLASRRRIPAYWLVGAGFVLLLVLALCLVINNVSTEPTVEQLNASCDGGEAKVCVDLGKRYASGSGVEMNNQSAAAAYKKACEAGDSDGCGGLEALGRVVLGAKEYAQAASILTYTCNQASDAEACQYMGDAYARGDGVAKSFSKAKSFYAKAAEPYAKKCANGDAEGCYQAGKLNLQRKDYGAAADFLQNACDKNNLYACNDLGWMLDGSTPGAPVRLEAAAAAYRKGCDGGGFDSCTNLGVMFDDGKGVQKDATQANALYQKGCNGGASSGCSNLGRNYWDGDGFPVDKARGLALLQKGCQMGDSWGCKEYKQLKAQSE